VENPRVRLTFLDKKGGGILGTATDIDALEENTHCTYYISVQLPTQSLAPILLYECLRRPHSAFLQYLDHPAALTEL
jgi:hypothetical protein